MRFDIITIFPEFFDGPLDYGIVRRARESHLISTGIHDLRNFTHDRHRTVDDRPFGGGEGMVLKPEPIFKAVETILERDDNSAQAPPDTAIVLLSASGKLFRQETARRLAKLERIVLLCGRYEGVDERVAEHLATEEISIGDIVLSGGELAAALIVDAVTRLIPGTLGNEDSALNESFSESPSSRQSVSDNSASSPSRGSVSSIPLSNSALLAYESRITNRGILDYPHYTRPPVFRGREVPEVLLSGDHETIRRWRRKKAIEKTLRNRPDLLADHKSPGSDH